MHLGSKEGEAGAAQVVATLNELLARMLNILRLVVVGGPVVFQSCYMHHVDFQSWILRLVAIYSLVAVMCVLAAPEQAYNGMACGQFRWVFEWLYPDARHWNGSVAADAVEAQSSLLTGSRGKELSGSVVQLRWHGTNKYLSLTHDGWAVTAEKEFAVPVRLEQVVAKGEKVPDTFTLRVESSSSWHQAWLSFQPVNQLRCGGWLGCYKDASSACPYKLVQDSSCPPGACKLLSAWPRLPTLSERPCTGFYVGEQMCGSRIFVGHAPDKDAALLEPVIAA